MMNVTFVTGDADLDKKFASEASAAGLKNLKGHRSVGGMRASIYNAMPTEGVENLKKPPMPSASIQRAKRNTRSGSLARIAVCR